MGTPELTPRIYVACLASYNAGTLHGNWIECTQEVESIRDEIKEMLKESREPISEEWAIHDYEGFGGLRLGEYESIEEIAKLAELIEERGELVTNLVEYVGGLGHLEEAKKKIEENYSGEWDSLEHWAEDFLESTGQLEGFPNNLRQYIDFEKYARDLKLGGEIFTIEFCGKVHVFWEQ